MTVLAFTQGDPAGVGTEILCKLLAAQGSDLRWRELVVAERAAFDALALPEMNSLRERLHFFDSPPDRTRLEALSEDSIAVLDPVGERRRVEPGRSGPADAAGAVAALDAAVDLVGAGVADALVTGPLSKASIARNCLPDFRGHTDYLAAKAGLERYGRDYLMTFLATDLQVALLTAHLPLREALNRIDGDQLQDALRLLDHHAGGRIAVPGLNPHAGEGGVLGSDEAEKIEPAVVAARRAGIDVHGPESPDSLFARARRGEYDWILALYHDQGLIAVKTVSFGSATNWTLGLPYLRTSVDHGTAFEIAGRGIADAAPLTGVVATTLALLAGKLPRKASPR